MEATTTSKQTATRGAAMVWMLLRLVDALAWTSRSVLALLHLRRRTA